MCARNIEFSIFSLEEKPGFKRLKGAQNANGVQKNGLPKIYIFFEKITQGKIKKVIMIEFGSI